MREQEERLIQYELREIRRIRRELALMGATTYEPR